MHTTLRELEDMFAHRGDAHVLLTLHDAESLRFSELAQRMYERSTVRIADNTIARALQRLESDDLVICDVSDARHPNYRLTVRGQEHTEVICRLVAALERHKEESGNTTW